MLASARTHVPTCKKQIRNGDKENDFLQEKSGGSNPIILISLWKPDVLFAQSSINQVTAEGGL